MHRARGDCLVALDEELVVGRLVRLAEVGDGCFVGDGGDAEVQRHVVGLDDPLAAGEPLGDELLEEVQGHVDELG